MESIDKAIGWRPQNGNDGQSYCPLLVSTSPRKLPEQWAIRCVSSVLPSTIPVPGVSNGHHALSGHRPDRIACEALNDVSLHCFIHVSTIAFLVSRNKGVVTSHYPLIRFLRGVLGHRVHPPFPYPPACLSSIAYGYRYQFRTTIFVVSHLCARLHGKKWSTSYPRCNCNGLNGD